MPFPLRFQSQFGHDDSIVVEGEKLPCLGELSALRRESSDELALWGDREGDTYPGADEGKENLVFER